MSHKVQFRNNRTLNRRYDALLSYISGGFMFWSRASTASNVRSLTILWNLPSEA